jgi:hypothetical protein
MDRFGRFLLHVCCTPDPWPRMGRREGLVLKGATSTSRVQLGDTFAVLGFTVSNGGHCRQLPPLGFARPIPNDSMFAPARGFSSDQQTIISALKHRSAPSPPKS